MGRWPLRSHFGYCHTLSQKPNTNQYLKETARGIESDLIYRHRGLFGRNMIDYEQTQRHGPEPVYVKPALGCKAGRVIERRMLIHR